MCGSVRLLVFCVYDSCDDEIQGFSTGLSGRRVREQYPSGVVSGIQERLVSPLVAVSESEPAVFEESHFI